MIKIIPNFNKIKFNFGKLAPFQTVVSLVPYLSEGWIRSVNFSLKSVLNLPTKLLDILRKCAGL